MFAEAQVLDLDIPKDPVLCNGDGEDARVEFSSRWQLQPSQFTN